MKLGPVTKPDKRNTSTSKKFEDNVMSANCDVMVFLPIYSKFAVIRNPDSGHIVYKFFILINSNVLSYAT